MSERQVLNDGCEGDVSGLEAALGERFEVLYSSCWGEDYEHAYDEIYRAADGRIVHAECGGCSCGGSGSWSYCESVEEARKLVPMWKD